MRAGGDHYRGLTGSDVALQMNRPGFWYWLYDDGRAGRIAFMYRYVPDCGYLCKVLQFEQNGLGYAPAAALFRAKLNEELRRESVVEFESAPILKAQPDKLSAVRNTFSEIISQTDQGDRVRLRLRRTSRQAKP